MPFSARHADYAAFKAFNDAAFAARAHTGALFDDEPTFVNGFMR